MYYVYEYYRYLFLLQINLVQFIHIKYIVYIQNSYTSYILLILSPITSLLKPLSKITIALVPLRLNVWRVNPPSSTFFASFTSLPWPFFLPSLSLLSLFRGHRYFCFWLPSLQYRSRCRADAREVLRILRKGEDNATITNIP